jgi:hypothetical protein
VLDFQKAVTFDYKRIWGSGSLTVSELCSWWVWIPGPLALQGKAVTSLGSTPSDKPRPRTQVSLPHQCLVYSWYSFAGEKYINHVLSWGWDRSKLKTAIREIALHREHELLSLPLVICRTLAVCQTGPPRELIKGSLQNKPVSESDSQGLIIH